MELGSEILAAVTAGLLRAVERRGLQREPLLRQAELSEAALQCFDSWVPIGQHLRLGYAIAAAFPGSNVGLQTGAPIYSDPQGALGFSLRRSAVHWRALANFAAYISTVNRAVRMQILMQPSETSIVVEMLPEMCAAGHPAESLLAAWLSISRHLTGAVWCPIRVDFQHQPVGDPEEHRALFGCDVAFGRAQTRMVLSAEVSALAIPELPHAFAKLLDDAAKRASVFLDPCLGTPESIAALLERLISVPLHIEELRSIADFESTEARLALGRALLERSAVFVHEVAYLLGFASVGCFQEAYSSRFGKAAVHVASQS